MTEKLYWLDAYIKEFDATVTKVDGNKIILNKTAFYPRGGGLVSDVGDVNGVKVLEVVRDGEDVAHVVENNSFQVGEQVHGRIDWEKRYKIMKLHTSAHLLSSILFKHTGALMTGGNIDSEKARDDFSVPLSKEEMQKFIDEANDAITKGAEIKIYFLPREEALKIPQIVKLAVAAPPDIQEWRIVEIVGYDTQADGGVHVKNISEIGKIQLLKIQNKGKNNRRLYYTVE